MADFRVSRAKCASLASWHAFCECFACRQSGRPKTKEKKMKLIIAYIQPDRLNAVKQSLFDREIYKISVTNALGCGQQGGYIHMYRGATEEVTLHKKMRLAIAVNDDYIEKTIEAIIEGARTGDIGDGKIFVLPMDECVRIRTGERGPAAIG
jgi:nitrogen regulatory protein P-II 1